MSSIRRNQLLSVSQAAKELTHGPFWLYEQVRLKKIPYHRIGRRIFFSQDDLDAYIAKSRVAALGEKKAKSSKEVVAR
jgi:excisionase family DNA binding protein